MNIALIAWLRGKPVPPKGYGGIERFTEIISLGLADLGHHVYLIAPPNSKSSHENVEVIECSSMVEATNIVASIKPDVVHDNTY